MRAIKEQEITPRASVLIESLRDIGYSLHTALADLIDNSLTAGARKIELFAETHAESPSVGILDDGKGMDRSELLEAMRPGSRNPLEGRSATDLGRFGLGLKTASFSQCRRLTVLTSRKGVMSIATWDLDLVAERDRWVVELPDSKDEIPWSDRIDGDGTLVVWQKLDRLVGLQGKDERQDFVRQVDEAASHIEFVFHLFLSGRENREGRVRISLNGRDLEPYDPFHAHHPATQYHQEETVLFDGKEIRIRPVTLPHHDKVSPEDWKRYAGPEGYVNNQGFYLYRNRRLIVHGTWFRLAPQAELTKLSRVLIDMPNSLDSDWKLDVKKASAQPPVPVRERVRRIVERLGGPSKRTYTARGARLTEDSLLPVWIRSQNKNRISYGLNAEHPLLSGFMRRLEDDLADDFRKLVALVVSTLPVEALYADVSANSESVMPQALDPNDFAEIVKQTWRGLRHSGLSTSDARSRMRTAEPFRGRWVDAETVIESLEKKEGEKT